MPTIDADCHVIETERAWDYLDESEKQYRPMLLTGTTESGVEKRFWLIDGKLRPRQASADPNIGGSKDSLSGRGQIPPAARLLDDVSLRLAHMDELDVDIQVLYPTIFLTPIAQHVEAEVALCKSYNRWLADIWSQSNDRLRWVVVPPLMDIDASISELRFGKENGACGIFMRGIELDRLMVDPYFHPMYEEAQRLDMPLCVHAGVGSSYWAGIFSAKDYTANKTTEISAEAFSRNKLAGISAFNSMLTHKVPDLLPNMFPRLRVGFIELSASWLPYVVTDLRRRLERGGDSLGDDPLGDARFYVACQTNDDLPHILRHVGENNLVIGSDYGHSDTSSELEALRNLKKNGELAPAVVDKILQDNPKALYGL